MLWLFRTGLPGQDAIHANSPCWIALSAIFLKLFLQVFDLDGAEGSGIL